MWSDVTAGQILAKLTQGHTPGQGLVDEEQPEETWSLRENPVTPLCPHRQLWPWKTGRPVIGQQRLGNTRLPARNSGGCD